MIDMDTYTMYQSDKKIQQQKINRRQGYIHTHYNVPIREKATETTDQSATRIHCINKGPMIYKSTKTMEQSETRIYKNWNNINKDT